MNSITFEDFLNALLTVIYYAMAVMFMLMASETILGVILSVVLPSMYFYSVWTWFMKARKYDLLMKEQND